jgi:hypothetical protein
MAQTTSYAKMRVAARLATGLALDLVKLAGFGRDVVDAVLITAIAQANAAQITRSPELQRKYATLDLPPPADLRRPVSISAVAHSLRIPFETARRRIAALAKLGLVVQTTGGVLVSTGHDNPRFRILAEAHYALVRDLYCRLRTMGFLEDLGGPALPAFDPGNPPLRLVMRLSADYLLRMAEPLTVHIGDLVTALIILDVFRANTEHLPDSEGGAEDPTMSIESFVPDELRRPVRAGDVADRLSMPRETARRRLLRLVADGRCERTPEGFFVPARVLARGPVIRFMQDNRSHLHRMYVALADYGVVAEWEHNILRLRGAA